MFRVACSRPNHFREYCRVAHRQLSVENPLVGIEDSCDSLDLHVVTTLKAIPYDSIVLGTETPYRKFLIGVVFCQDCPHRKDGLLVVIPLSRLGRVKVMRSARFVRVSCCCQYPSKKLDQPEIPKVASNE